MASTTNTVWRFVEKGKGARGLKQSHEPIPVPLPHQCLLRVHSVSLNYRDVAIVSGTYPVPYKDNVVLCGDLAAEVVKVGESTTKFKTGDRVTAVVDVSHIYGYVYDFVALGGRIDGALQEYLVLDEIALLHAPDYLTYDEIACFPIAGLTAWNSLYGSGNPLLPGQTALFQGTGGVSIFGLQIARAAGARTIVTSSSDEKLELAKKLGASYVINYKKNPDWDKEVKKITKGEGVHHIFDNVGIMEIERCFGAVARGGVISNIGFLGGAAPQAVNTPMLALKTDSMMRGILGGSKQQFEELLRFAEVHELRPHIDKVFPFAQAVEAIEYLASGQHFGKIIVQVVPSQ